MAFDIAAYRLSLPHHFLLFVLPHFGYLFVTWWGLMRNTNYP